MEQTTNVTGQRRNRNRPIGWPRSLVSSSGIVNQGFAPSASSDPSHAAVLTSVRDFSPSGLSRLPLLQRHLSCSSPLVLKAVQVASCHCLRTLKVSQANIDRHPGLADVLQCGESPNLSSPRDHHLQGVMLYAISTSACLLHRKHSILNS